MLGILGFANAQTANEISSIQSKSNITELNKLKVEVGAREASRIQRVNAHLSANPLANRQLNAGNTTMQLFDVVNGLPVYLALNNVDAARTTRTHHLNSNGSLGLQLNGQGMTAHIWDGGPVRTTHQEFGGRVLINDGSTSLNNNSWHSTHVAGTIAASGLQPMAKGMAYQCTVKSHEWYNDLSEAITEASNGMLISNHSYEQRTYDPYELGAYNDYSRSWDQLMYNAPFYLMVVAAGNSGETDINSNPVGGIAGYDKMSYMKTCKNNLVVASAEDVPVNPNGTFAATPIISSFSSQGPTDDLRIKPDITGNGSAVYSSMEKSDDDYNNSWGTSMAAPNVSGSLLLLQQHYKNVTGSFMKSSTLKGLALHTADDAGATGPDAVFGWGILNAKRAAETISTNSSTSFIAELTLMPGQTYTKVVQASGIAPLMASICWTDLPGLTSGALNSPTPVLINDLDIRITKNTTTFFPYKLTSSTSNTNADNTVDPFERVDVAGASGSYTVTVSHKGSLSSGSQSYALIITGIKPQENMMALSFNGSQDFVEVPSYAAANPGSGDFTIEARIKANPTQALLYPTIVSCRQNEYNGYILFIHTGSDPWSGGTLWLQLNGTNYPLYGPKLTDGLCHHIALKVVGNDIRYYLDGVLRMNRPVTGARAVTTIGKLRIGHDIPNSSMTYFNGEIGEVRLWNVARTDYQIVECMNKSISGKETGLVGYWRLNEGTGQRAFNSALLADKVTYQPHGTLGAFTTLENADPTWVSSCTSIPRNQGASFENPHALGILSTNSINTVTTNNTTSNKFSDDYGQESDDVYYSFEISQNSLVSVQLCASSLNDTYLHLFNSSKTRISVNDDNSAVCGTTNGRYKSQISVNLIPGVYYVAVEGYSSNAGNITSTFTVGTATGTPIGRELEVSSSSEQDAELWNAAEVSETHAYPNPIHSGELFFGKTVQKYSLMDNAGVLLMEGTNANALSIEGLHPGLYLLKLDDKVEKIVIQ